MTLHYTALLPTTLQSISGFVLPFLRRTLFYSLLFLKLPPPPCAVLLVICNGWNVCFVGERQKSDYLSIHVPLLQENSGPITRGTRRRRNSYFYHFRRRWVVWESIVWQGPGRLWIRLKHVRTEKWVQHSGSCINCCLRVVLHRCSGLNSTGAQFYAWISWECPNFRSCCLEGRMFFTAESVGTAITICPKVRAWHGQFS